MQGHTQSSLSSELQRGISSRVECACARAMHVLVHNALSGEEVAKLFVEQVSPTVRDVQKLVKNSLGVPKKALHIVDGAARLAPRDPVPSSSILRVLVSYPVCSYCGAAPERLRTCSSCLDAFYCGVLCQRKHWCLHRDACALRHKPTCGAAPRTAVPCEGSLPALSDVASSQDLATAMPLG